MPDDSTPASTPTGYQRTTGGNVRWQPPTVEHLQALFPQYEIIELLGHGGMGAVYKARQLTLDRLVAIKILPPEAADDGEANFVERFKNEARTMARLDHPAIVHVHDFGETAEGQLYFVMQFVEGTDVQKMVKGSGRLPAEHALAIAAHVCDALTYAHTHGVIHRDIKPANVLIDMEGAVKVADFGLAKATEDGHSMGLTATGTTMGTPDYVAPETLVLGMAADHRADLYALGVMLYHMLTGEVPRGKWKMPSVTVGSDVRFDAIIDRAMETDREERYQSAVEIRQDLDKIITMPMMQSGGQSSAAIPQKSVLRESSASMPQPFGGATLPAISHYGKPWVIPAALAGVAMLGLGAFMMFGGKKTNGSREALWSAAGSDSATPLSQAPASSKSTTTPPAPKPPAVVAQTAPVPPKKDGPATVKATETPPASATTPSGQGASSAPAKAVSPMPGDPGISATALHNAGAPKITPAPEPKPPTPEPEKSLLPSAATSLPAELAALDEQFQKLQAERVTAVFEADVLKLNTGYSGGLEREVAKEKAAGHLDAVLALEVEKKLIADKQPMPSLADEETSNKKTPDSVKKLRVIYRDAYTKLEVQREANLKLITTPLMLRLVTLESDYTKKDRIADAKVAREYREALAESGLPSPTPPTTAPETVKATPPVKPTLPIGASAKDGLTNTLGMKLVPVLGTKVLFCIHTTRVKDYAAYAAEVPGVDSAWKKQVKDGIPISDKDDDPVVSVSWEDAQAFCAWLSKKENRTYRLPTDREWSIAVGLGTLEKVTKGITPAMLNNNVPNVFPWGVQWPPPKGSGNYADMSYKAKFPAEKNILEGYTDGFATTSPVMSFKANKHGLYDMSGNVWQWCEDWYDATQKHRVLRGGSWHHLDGGALLSSYRLHHLPGHRNHYYGFRVVVQLSAP